MNPRWCDGMAVLKEEFGTAIQNTLGGYNFFCGKKSVYDKFLYPTVMFIKGMFPSIGTFLARNYEKWENGRYRKFR